MEFLGRFLERREGRDAPTSDAARDAQYDAIVEWGIPDHGALQRLTGIQSPTLVIQGDNDLMIPTKLSHLLAGLIPDAQIRIYPDAAHGFLFQYPAEVAADVNAFLASRRERRIVSTPATLDSWTFETLTVQIDGAVLFAEIAAPPMNLLGPELVRDLVSLIQRAEADDACKVLVFKSADPDYFISHVDLTQVAEYRAEAAKLTGEASIALLFRHLSASRLVTIAQIEGRVRSGRQRVRAGLRHALRRARDRDLRPVRVGVRSDPRRRGHPVPRTAHGPRPSARGPAERRRLRRGARRTVRLDQSSLASRRRSAISSAALAQRIAAFPAAGQVAIKDRINAISLAPTRRLPARFRSLRRGRAHRRDATPDPTAMRHGLQTRDAEMDLAAMLADLDPPLIRRLAQSRWPLADANASRRALAAGRDERVDTIIAPGSDDRRSLSVVACTDEGERQYRRAPLPAQPRRPQPPRTPPSAPSASTCRRRSSPSFAAASPRRAGPPGARRRPVAGRPVGDDPGAHALLGERARLAQGRGEAERAAAVQDRDRRARHPLHPRQVARTRTRCRCSSPTAGPAR